MAFQALEEKETNTMFLHLFIYFFLIATSTEIYLKKSINLTNSKHLMLEKLS